MPSAAAAQLVGEAVDHALRPARARCCSSLPEDVLDELVRRGRQVSDQPDVPRPPDGRRPWPTSLAAPRRRRATGHPGRRRRAPRRRTSTTSCASRAARVPVVAVVAPADGIPERSPALPRHDRLRRPAERSASGSPRPTRCSSSAAGSTRSTTFDYRIPRAAPALGPRRPRARGAVPTGLPPARVTRRGGRRAFLRAALERLGRSASSTRAVATRRPTIAADRAAYEAATVVRRRIPWDGPGVHPGRMSWPRSGGSLPDDAILTTDAGNFGTGPARASGSGGPGTLPRPDLGRDGLRPARRDRRRPRPSRSAGRGARRRRRPRR